MKNSERLPRSLKHNLIVQELDDETLVYDPERDEAHCLNQIAALIWDQCDGRTTAWQASRTIQKQLAVRADTDLVWLAVKQLKKFHLVDGGSKSPLVSRRDLVLKYAPAALALPVIMSIAAPMAQAAASCIANGSDCSGGGICCSGPGHCCGFPTAVCQAGGC